MTSRLRRLPGPAPADLGSRLDALAADRTSGAAEITGAAAELLGLLARGGPGVPPASVLAGVEDVALRLLDAHASMAPVINLVNITLRATEEGAASLGQVRAGLRRFRALLRAGIRRTAENGAGLIRDADVIVTLSYSSTILAAMRKARACGRRFRVVCGEGRPRGEGTHLATRLARSGIPAMLTTDMGLFGALGTAARVLVGADCVATGGLVNKTGTLGLALAARAQGVPMYALADETKFLPPPLEPWLRITEQDPAEILPAPPANLQVQNRYFDRTPLDLLTGVVTAEGSLGADDVSSRLAGVPVARRLLSAA
jgi:translation initiation factor 2B subunit (eIF-2B alpha/beta/delta family)